MRAGKDIYSEKPSSMTIAEGQAVLETAQRYGRIYQTGTQRLSEDNFTFANELLRTGRLGHVHTVRAHIAPWDAAEMNYGWAPAEPEPPKDEVDWDAWLGPAPKVAFNSGRLDYRSWIDYTNGIISDYGNHRVLIYNSIPSVNGASADVVLGQAGFGLGGANGVAILLPLTFTMPPTSAIIMLSCIYWGALFGGAITSILFNIPGEPWSVATTFDGFPMARKGEPGRALWLGIWASIFGGLLGAVFLVATTGPLAQIALKFGPAEYFAVMVLAFTTVSAVLGASAARGLASLPSRRSTSDAHRLGSIWPWSEASLGWGGRGDGMLPPLMGCGAAYPG